MDSAYRYAENRFQPARGLVASENPFLERGSGHFPTALGPRSGPGQSSIRDGSRAERVRKQMLLKQQISRNIVATEGSIVPELMSRLHLKADEPGALFRASYSRLRKLGIVYQESEAIRTKPEDLTTEGLTSGGLSLHGHYANLIELGNLLFPGDMPVERRGCIHFWVEYPAVGILPEDEIGSQASALIRHEVEIETTTRQPLHERKPVELYRGELLPETRSGDFLKLQQNRLGKDLLARALKLDKRQSDKLDSERLHTVAKSAVGSSRVTRYVKLWSYYLWALARGDTCRVRSEHSVSFCGYDQNGLSDAVNGLLKGSD